MSNSNLYLNSLHIGVIICVYVKTLASENKPCITDTQQIYEWTADTFPNPRVDIDKCGRNCTKSWICDPNHVINPRQADYLDKKIEMLRQVGRCSCSSCYIDVAPGFTISIALLAKIKVYGGGEASKEAAKTLAQELRQKWNFQKCNDDVIILVSRDDRKVFTDIGSTVEQVLTYDCIQAIYLSVKSKLSTGRFAEGLDDMIQKYRYVLDTGNCDIYQREASVHSHREDEEEEDKTKWTIILSVMGGFIFLVLLCKLCQCCRGGGVTSTGGMGKVGKYHGGGIKRRSSSFSSIGSSCSRGSFGRKGSFGGGSCGGGGSFGGGGSCGGNSGGGGSF